LCLVFAFRPPFSRQPCGLSCSVRFASTAPGLCQLRPVPRRFRLFRAAFLAAAGPQRLELDWTELAAPVEEGPRSPANSGSESARSAGDAAAQPVVTSAPPPSPPALSPICPASSAGALVALASVAVAEQLRLSVLPPAISPGKPSAPLPIPRSASFEVPTPDQAASPEASAGGPEQRGGRYPRRVKRAPRLDDYDYACESADDASPSSSPVSRPT
jgi:hypothetical protein